MELFRADGHLTETALTALARGESLDELTRLEIAEHLSFCDQCLQRYTDLLASIELSIPERSCQDTLWQRTRSRTLRLFTSRYTTAVAAVALALTVLWGGNHLALPPVREALEATSQTHTESWPEQWNEALSGFSGELREFFGQIGTFRETLKGDRIP